MATEETTKPRRTRTVKPKPAPAPKPQTDSDLTEFTDDKGKKLTVQQLKNKLRGQAERAVLDKYKNEVQSNTEALYKEHNLEYVRRLSDEEKAAKEIADHINKYPQLMHLFAPAALAQLAKEQSIPLDPDHDPYDDEGPAVPGPVEGSLLEPTDAEWAEQQQRIHDVAAADGVEFHEGE
ncbi:hypothetical protein SEA_BRUHMOMENT_81 [Arthrobacter phage BruhMoment]|nr:hypothetical protein SEA_BRUHMOMENT_81 [Arthrobacter phage BruhMoment]